MISAMVRLPIHVPILLPVHLSILLPIHLSIILPVLLPVCLAIRLPILLPIGPTIFLTNVGLRQHHRRHHGWGCHSHDQAGNQSGFQHAALHDSSSLILRELINLSHSKTVKEEKGKQL
jgi:hypothetical protein